MEEQGATKDFDKDIKKQLTMSKKLKRMNLLKFNLKLYRKTYDCKTRNYYYRQRNNKTKIKGTNTLEDDKLKLDYALDFDQDKYTYAEAKYTIKGVSSKEKTINTVINTNLVKDRI